MPAYGAAKGAGAGGGTVSGKGSGGGRDRGYGGNDDDRSKNVGGSANGSKVGGGGNDKGGSQSAGNPYGGGSKTGTPSKGGGAGGGLGTALGGNKQSGGSPLVSTVAREGGIPRGLPGNAQLLGSADGVTTYRVPGGGASTVDESTKPGVGNAPGGFIGVTPTSEFSLPGAGRGAGGKGSASLVGDAEFTPGPGTAPAAGANPYAGGLFGSEVGMSGQPVGLSALFSGGSVDDVLGQPGIVRDINGVPYSRSLPGSMAGVVNGIGAMTGAPIGLAMAIGQQNLENEIEDFNANVQAGQPYGYASSGSRSGPQGISVSPGGDFAMVGYDNPRGAPGSMMMNPQTRERMTAEITANPGATVRFNEQDAFDNLQGVNNSWTREPGGSDRQPDPVSGAAPAGGPRTPQPVPNPGAGLGALFDNVDLSGLEQAYLDIANPALENRYNVTGSDLDYVLRRTGQEGTETGQGLRSQLADLLTGAEGQMQSQAEAFRQQRQQAIRDLRAQFMQRLQAGEDPDTLAAEAQQALASLQGQQPTYDATPFADFRNTFSSIPVIPGGAGVYVDRY